MGATLIAIAKLMMPRPLRTWPPVQGRGSHQIGGLGTVDPILMVLLVAAPSDGRAR